MVNAKWFPSRMRAAEKLRERETLEDEGRLANTTAAWRAMTDFEIDYPITVDIHRTIEDAASDMARLRVHALLVIRQRSHNIDPQIMGLITSHEIQAAYRTVPPGNAEVMDRAKSLAVGDVMTAWDDLSTLRYRSLESLTVWDLFEMFQGTGLTHLLVVDEDAMEVAVARGVLSRATLARRLGRSRHSLRCC